MATRALDPSLADSLPGDLACVRLRSEPHGRCLSFVASDQVGAIEIDWHEPASAQIRFGSSPAQSPGSGEFERHNDWADWERAMWVPNGHNAPDGIGHLLSPHSPS